MSAVDLIATNLSIGLEDIILLVSALGTMIIAAKDLRIAIMFAVLLFLSAFILYYELGLNTYKTALAFLLSIALLSLSLLISFKKSGRGVSLV